MDGLISSGNHRTFEDFKRQIPEATLPLYQEIRDYCISLGDNVVEDVRMHRIVFGKSMSFRWFADLEPSQEGVIIKIQKDRKEPPTVFTQKPNQGIDDLKSILEEAFTKIH